MDSVEALGLIRATLRPAADPERAAGQQAYMKSAMPFHGVATPDLRRLIRPLLDDLAPPDRPSWECLVRGVWDGATHREERYVALALARHRRARAWQDPGALGLYEYLIRSGAWWDLVDEIANHLVSPILAAHRATVTPVMDAWAGSDDLWVRRVAIISQLKHRAETDGYLLARCIDANLPGSPFGKDFFIRKAIGWALREFAKTKPGWVASFVRSRADELSPLSLREATKHLAVPLN